MDLANIIARLDLSIILALLVIGCSDFTGPTGGGERLWIDKAGLLLLPGETVQLNVWRQQRPADQVLPSAEIEWSSAAPGVARIDEDGTLLGLTLGSAVITARSTGAIDTTLVRVMEARPSQNVRWQAVSVGAESTCAVDEDGTAYCWGADYFGTLGAGSRREWTITYMPIRVDGETTYRDVDLGGRHACGVATSGAVSCWGSGLSLGLAGGAVEAPQLVEGQFSEVDAGLNHTCALAFDGSAHCWGLGAYGELGLGAAEITRKDRPQVVNGEHRFVQLAAGDAVSCGVAMFGELFCWGLGAKTGVGYTDAVVEPTRVHIDGSVVRVSGEDHMCAETDETGIYCWGPNRWRQILGASAEWVYEPFRIDSSEGLAQIEAGVVSSCASGSAGEIYCWGWNRDGGLGIGEASEQRCGGVDSVPCELNPGRLSGGLHFTSLSLGARSSCGITVDAALYCWGSNEFGQLGVGFPLAYSASPVQVVDPF